MKHIVHVSNDFEPLSSGINTHLKNLLPSLAKMDLQISLLVPTASNNFKERIYRETKASNHYSIIRSYYEASKNPIGKLFQLTRSTQNGLQWIQNNIGAIDLIHQHDQRATRLGAIRYARKKEIPVIWTNHSSGFFRKNEISSRMISHIPGLQPDGLVVVHRFLVTRLREYFNNCSLAYIPNGVNPDHFSFTEILSKKESIIFFPQRMIFQKGIMQLAKAAKFLIENPDVPNKQFWFAGSTESSNRDSDLIHEVKNLLAPLVERDIVRFLGNLSYMEMSEFYEKADIVVLPFRMGTESLSLYEAWASGTPVISLKLNETNEYVLEGENCILLDSNDPQVLADAIHKLSLNVKLRKKIAKNGYEMATKHCRWSQRAVETVRFYREILNARKE